MIAELVKTLVGKAADDDEQADEGDDDEDDEGGLFHVRRSA